MDFKILISALIFMGSVGFLLGLVIALANKFFGVKENPFIEQVEQLLPGVNCGGCGFAGCSAFAKAIVEGKCDATLCPVNNSENVTAIAALLGKDLSQSEAKVAVVLCCGDNISSPEKALYNGVNDCNSAVLVAGATKACQHGCLGLASCSRACPFNAIEIDMQRMIAVVHADLCVGCAKCVATCPRNLIKLVPKQANVHILCNSPEKAPVQKKACSHGCIGCRKCTKEVTDDAILMHGFLAVIDYSKPVPTSVAEVCPVKCIKSAIAVNESKEV